MKREATFAPDPTDSKSKYRISLRRDWTDELTLFDSPERAALSVLAVMLNPSIADANIDDPTIAKLIRLCRAWGFGSLDVGNLWPLRSTYPENLRKEAHPKAILATNDAWILERAWSPHTGLTIAAWGNHGVYLGRGNYMRDLLKRSGRPVHCFRWEGPQSPLSNEGQPVHPLYQPEGTLETLARWF